MDVANEIAAVNNLGTDFKINAGMVLTINLKKGLQSNEPQGTSVQTKPNTPVSNPPLDALKVADRPHLAPDAKLGYEESDDPLFTRVVIYGNGGENWNNSDNSYKGTVDIGTNNSKLLYARVWEWDHLQNIFVLGSMDDAELAADKFIELRDADINKKTSNGNPLYYESASVPGVYWSYLGSQAEVQGFEYDILKHFTVLFYTANEVGKMTRIDKPINLDFAKEQKAHLFWDQKSGWQDKKGKFHQF